MATSERAAVPTDPRTLETSGTPDSGPFFFEGGAIGCLLLHGFTGTPHEMRFLGEHLAARGYSVNGVRLAGHGTSVEELDRCKSADWYASARAGLAALRQRCDRVAVVGQSMGALLALQLALNEPDAVVSVTLLAPALMLGNPWLRWVGPLFPWALALLPPHRRYVGKGESDIADPAARSLSPSYRRVPLRALHQFLQLQRRVRRALPQLQQPLLVIHARQDHTCPFANVALLAASVRVPLQTRVLESSYHVISVDVEKEQVAADVSAFVASTAGPPGAVRS